MRSPHGNPSENLRGSRPVAQGSRMFTLLKTAWRFVIENNTPVIWRALISRDAHPLLQFFKYGMCGVAATVIHQGLFFALAYSFLPAGDGMIVDGKPITNELRYWNGIINNTIAFLPALVFSYWLNARFVFTPGRHKPVMEFALFALVASIGNTAGLIGGPKLIDWFGVPTWVSQLTFIFTSFLVNFLCRKFVIFKS